MVCDYDQTSDRLEESTASSTRFEATQKLQNLSRREREVLFYIVTGNANKEIAYKLHISQRTVENHRARIIEKTGCRNIPALVGLVTIGAVDCLPYCTYNGRCHTPEGKCRFTSALGSH